MAKPKQSALSLARDLAACRREARDYLERMNRAQTECQSLREQLTAYKRAVKQIGIILGYEKIEN